jgi:hypothetical protein
MGDHPPGLPAGATFSALWSPSLTASGGLAFAGKIQGGGATAETDSGIWVRENGVLLRVIQEGQQAPGLAANLKIGDVMPTAVVLDSHGNMAFAALISGPGINPGEDSALWSGKFPAPVLVARRRTAGSRRSRSGILQEFRLCVDSVDQCARPGGVRRPADRSQCPRFQRHGIWATDLDGNLKLIARESAPLEVSPGVFKTVAQLSFHSGTNNEDGRPRGFNNLGQVVFQASFTDGSQGIFVSSAVAVPKPPGWALAILATAWPFRRRRHQARKADSSSVSLS